jgi:hypothetical protein
MTNPYSPPNSPVEDPAKPHVYTEQYKREKNAARPLGVVAVVVMFVLFSVLGAALLLLDRDAWVVVYTAVSALLVYWFRSLWWGDDKERKVAVLVGFLIAAASYLGAPDGSIYSWSASELASAAEGLYFFLAACYLAYIRNDPFFAPPRAH